MKIFSGWRPGKSGVTLRKLPVMAEYAPRQCHGYAMLPSRTHRVSFALVSRCLRLSPELPRGYPPSGTGIREADIQPFFTILLSYIKKNLIFAPASRGEILLKSRSAFNVKIANFNYRQAQTSCHRWVVCLCLYGCLAIPNVKWTAAHFFYFMTFP